MQTTDADLLFQAESDSKRADARRRKAAVKRRSGNPIELYSRPLDLLVTEDCAWIACSGFVTKCYDLNSRKLRRMLRGHKGPVSAVTAYKTASQKSVIITGSWDKSIQFTLATSDSPFCTIHAAHTDFVKALLVIQSLNLLVSGGSDKDIRLFDLSSVEHSQPPCLLSLREHSRPIECLKYWTNSKGDTFLISADTMGKGVMFSLSLQEKDIAAKRVCEWREHETAIYDLVLTSDGIWTASADKTVLFSSFDFENASGQPLPSIRIQHPYYVKSILPLLALLPDLEEDLLISGSSDESLRVYDVKACAKQKKSAKREEQIWDLSSTNLAERDSGLLRSVDDFAHEVNKLAIWTKVEDDQIKSVIVAASLDETLRTWPVDQLIDPNFKLDLPPLPATEVVRQPVLSQEEEDELAALMAD